LKRRAPREPAPPIPPLSASRVSANVELTPPTQDPADVQAHVTQENIADFERYLLWADKAMHPEKRGAEVTPGAAPPNRDLEAHMDNENLKLAKYEPLTFQCVRCEQQFNASGKSIEQVAGEVSDHITREHPDLSNSWLQHKKAA